MLGRPFVVFRPALIGFVAVLLAMSGTALSPASAVEPPTTCKNDVPRSESQYPTYPRNGRPTKFAAIADGNYFSYPNRSGAERGAIMNRVINTIQSTWGTYYVPVKADQPTTCLTDEDGQYTAGWSRRQGSIRMTTWTFNHRGVRDALINAEKRGASVQIIAARGINARGVDGKGPYKPWYQVRNFLRNWGKNTNSYGWECGGACRGSGGAPHSKYFLFNNVGSAHSGNIVVQTSMNLTPFAVTGQWNQATAIRGNSSVYADFLHVFRQSTPRYGGGGYYARSRGFVTNIFFPKGRAADPVMSMLNRVRCKTGNRRTKVRLINYAIHDKRGNAVAKRLRTLWGAGCDVRIIYSLSSRPVLKILRSHAGRGPIPVRQSVIKNRKGEIVKYNHSKWLAVSGNYGGSPGRWTALSGSSNMSNLAFTSDEQMQQLYGYRWTKGYFSAFSKTWGQKTSRPPRYGRMAAGTGTLAPQEVVAEQEALKDVPLQPTWGKGIYKYMAEGG